MAVKISTLSEWNQLFDEKMVPLIVPDGRGKWRKITSDMVKKIIEVAKELKSKGRRIRLKSFAKQVETEKGIVLSSKKVGEILIANGLYKPETKNRRPKFYQALRQGIPNGLVSVDGSEFIVWIDKVPYKFNLELAVDVESFCHTGFSVSDSETSLEFIKVLEAHKKSWGTPIGIVSDHGSANISDESRVYLDLNDIVPMPAGPANPKGDGTVEGAFSEMKEAIGKIDFETSSPGNLAKTILEKVVSIYIAMRNRLPRIGEKISPEEGIKAPVSKEEQKELKDKFKDRIKKEEYPDQITKLDRLGWVIKNHGLEVDEQSLKRAEKCIVTYDLIAISKSETAFLKAIRRDQQRRTLPYFFGILNNIQKDLDSAQYEDYCRKCYYYQGMLDREREEQEKETTTVKGVVGMLRNAILLTQQFVKDTCVRQAKRMAVELKKQYHYVGALRKNILDELNNVKEFSIEQRKNAVEILDMILS